jgi:hypothetical protein
MVRRIFSEDEARLLRDFANLDQGHKFIRLVTRFRLADEQERAKLVRGELGALLEFFDARGHSMKAREITDLLRDKTAGGMIPHGIESEVQSIIKGGKEVCRT